MKSFSGGVHPPHYKDSSLVNPIKHAQVPPLVTIPLAQHIGAPAVPIVKVGDEVKAGTKIGEADGFISSAVHASISGKIKKIDMFLHPTLTRGLAIQIESDGKDEREDAECKEQNAQAFTPAEIVNRVKEAGIVGLGGAAFPTHVKLSPPSEKKIDTVIINGAECEPYLTCDHMLMLFNPVELIKGALLIMRAVGAKQCFIGVEENKLDALELMFSKVRSQKVTNIIPVGLKVKYPQGAEKQLISGILRREVPVGGLPMDVGVVVHNVGTAVAVYKAVCQGRPLYERLVTVCGRSLKMSQNVVVRIGTPFGDVIKEVGGLINHPLRLIMGGPMMGIAQESFDVPVVKATSGILTISPGQFRFPRTRPCIRCGRCVDICPMGLVPSTITAAGDSERWEKAEQFGVSECMECGSCAYICPAKRPMIHTIKVIKHELLKAQVKT